MTFRFLSCYWLLFILSGTGVEAADSSEILLKESAGLAHFETMDGSPNSEPVSSSQWKQAVFELRRSAQTDPGWPDPWVAVSRERKQSEWKEVPLMLLHAAYRRPNAEGLESHNEVFAVSSLREKVYYGSGLRFLIREGDILTHGVTGIESIFLDAGDGNGLRPLHPGRTVSVSYQSTGIKSLTLKANMSDGRTLWSKTQLEIAAETTPEPDFIWEIEATEPYDGSVGSGLAYIYLAEGHATLVNPVVVVEGFDIDDSIDWPVLYNLLNRENMLEDIRAQGYDAVVLDFANAVDYIQRNAFVLTALLARVRSEISTGQTVTLVGASMGGVVARYALLWQEQENITSRVRNFISFDAPHGGANIPLGLQEWVDFFSGSADEANFLNQRLNAPASRQMLLYHLGSRSGTTANPDPLKAALEQEMAAMGAWPAAPKLASIINGSGSMAGQGFDPGEQILQYEASGIRGNVWALPQSSDPQTKIFDGLLVLTSRQVRIQGSTAWDNAPGGSRATMQQAADAAAPIGDIVALHNSHSFVPSVSALYLQGANPFHDIAGDPNLPGSTPFDQVYFPAENQEHIDVTAQNKDWFLSEITWGDCDLSILPAGASFTSAGGNSSFGVTSPPGCEWKPAESDFWITLNSGDGSGNGTVSYSVAENTGIARSGGITIGGQTHNITQSGDVTCSYAISPGDHSFTSAGGSSSFMVTSPPGCNWIPAESDFWITLNSGDGSGNGTVSYSVAENTGSARSGSITIGGQTHNITQSGGVTLYTLSVSKSGSGSGAVTSNPSGINCGSTCSASFGAGTIVTLTAIAASGSTFTGWGGACTAAGTSITCSSTLEQSLSVTASFNLDTNLDTFSVGGTVNGLAGSGLVLQNTGSDDLPITANGNFTFTPPLDNGSGYAVTVKTQPSDPDQICLVTNSNGSISGANITSVQVTCTLTTSCNVNILLGGTETSEASHEACEILVVGDGFTAEDKASVNLSSGQEIWFMPDTLIEKGATLEAHVCGQSLCKTSSKPMPLGCHSCIDQICALDLTCCDTDFDQTCLNMVDTVCGLVCE